MTMTNGGVEQLVKDGKFTIYPGGKHDRPSLDQLKEFGGSITCLDLDEIAPGSFPTLLQVMNFCPNVNSIEICRNAVDYTQFTELIKCYPGLKSITIAHDDNWGDRALTALAAHCPGLTTVNYWWSSITDKGVIALAENCSGLTKVSFNGKIGNAGLLAVAKNCPSLTYACFEGRVTSEGVFAFAKTVGKGLRTVRFPDIKLTDHALGALAKHCSQLTKADFSLNKGVTDAGIQAFALRCHSLIQINLSSTSVGDVAASALAQNCPGLVTVDFDWTSIGDIGATALAKNCPGLKSVCFESTQVGDEGLIALAQNCPQLQGVRLKKCRKITSRSVVMLAKHCPELESINLGYVQVGDEGVIALAQNCPRLRAVEFEGNSITERALKMFQHPELKWLALGYTRIPEAALNGLKKRCPKLRSLIYLRSDSDVQDKPVSQSLAPSIDLLSRNPTTATIRPSPSGATECSKLVPLDTGWRFAPHDLILVQIRPDDGWQVCPPEYAAEMIRFAGAGVLCLFVKGGERIPRLPVGSRFLEESP